MNSERTGCFNDEVYGLASSNSETPAVDSVRPGEEISALKVGEDRGRTYYAGGIGEQVFWRYKTPVLDGRSTPHEVTPPTEAKVC